MWAKKKMMTTCENFFLLLMPCSHIIYMWINRKCKTKQNKTVEELSWSAISVAECEIIIFYYVCVQIWLDSVALCIYRRYSKKKCGSNRIFLSSFFSLAFLVSVAYFLLSSPMQQKQIQIFFLHIQHTRHKNSTALVARGCDGMSEI